MFNFERSRWLRRFNELQSRDIPFTMIFPYLEFGFIKVEMSARYIGRGKNSTQPKREIGVPIAETRTFERVRQVKFTSRPSQTDLTSAEIDKMIEEKANSKQHLENVEKKMTHFLNELFTSGQFDDAEKGEESEEKLEGIIPNNQQQQSKKLSQRAKKFKK